MTEYAETIEVLVADMNREVDAASVEIDAGGADLAQIRAAFERRSAARSLFVEGFSDLDPPELAEEMHAASLEIITLLGTAERAVAERAAEAPAGDTEAVWRSEEFRALEDIDNQAIAFCELAQAAFDETSEREGFEGSSWMPPELKEVIDVAFRCDSAQR